MPGGSRLTALFSDTLQRTAALTAGAIGGGQGNQEVAISDGAFKDDKVSFTVTRERNGQKFTQKYTGTVSGDTIKGKIESERGGQSRSVDWEAKRQK